MINQLSNPVTKIASGLGFRYDIKYSSKKRGVDKGMIKHWQGFIIKVTLILSVVIILTPTTSLAKSISKQQTGAIQLSN